MRTTQPHYLTKAKNLVIRLRKRLGSIKPVAPAMPVTILSPPQQPPQIALPCKEPIKTKPVTAREVEDHQYQLLHKSLTKKINAAGWKPLIIQPLEPLPSKTKAGIMDNIGKII